MWKPKKEVRITRRTLLSLFVATALLVVLAVLANRTGGDVTDTVSKIEDGETLFVGLTKVRLAGIAVPPLDEPQGEEAKRTLTEAALGKSASCRLSGSRSWDRIDAHCSVAGQDLGELLVRAGVARDCPRRSNGRYAAFESERSQAIPLPEHCRPQP